MAYNSIKDELANTQTGDSQDLSHTSTCILKLNVGGHKFETTKSTLSNVSVFFSSLLSGRYFSLKDENGAYFIDRNGEYFAPILYYMRTRHLIIPPSMNIEALLHEVEYYLLEDMANELKEIINPPEIIVPKVVQTNGAYCNKTDSKLFIFDNRKGVMQLQTRENCALTNAKGMWDLEGVPSIWGATVSCKDIYAKFIHTHVRKGQYQIEEKFVKIFLPGKEHISGMVTSIGTLSFDCNNLYILDGMPSQESLFEFEEYIFHPLKRRGKQVYET